VADQGYELAEAYSGLRNTVLGTKPESIGLDPARLPGGVWGLLMETGHPTGVATLVALADGTVSLYFSGGGGMIGLGQHEGPRRSAAELLAMAPDFREAMVPAADFPLPRPGHTRFQVLSGGGPMTGEGLDEDLISRRHALSALFYKGHEVLGEIRSVDQPQRRA
jgi:hypothetical protein